MQKTRRKWWGTDKIKIFSGKQTKWKLLSNKISKPDSGPIEKMLWHFEVKVITGGEKRNNCSRQIHHHLSVVSEVYTCVSLRHNSFNFGTFGAKHLKQNFHFSYILLCLFPSAIYYFKQKKWVVCKKRVKRDWKQTNYPKKKLWPFERIDRGAK